MNRWKTHRGQIADVVILGAGAAGIAAARMLQEAGLRVVVLEARRRVGGRVRTDYSLASHPVELGAEFIHGQSALTWKYVKALGFQAIPVANHGCCFMHDRLFADDTAPVPACEELMSRLKAKAREHLAAGKPDQSIRQFLDTQQGYPLGPSFTATRRLLSNLIASEKGADIYAMSLSGLLEHDFSGYGDHNFRIVEGYGKLLQQLAGDLDIRLGQIVRRVNWSSGHVSLRCQDRSFEARHAVISLPLGVLQAGDVKFDPPLPEQKVTAIRRLGAAAVCKVILKFREPFWPHDMAVLATTMDTQVWWPAGWGRPGRSGMLTALVGGEAARRMGTHSSAGTSAVIADSLKQLQTMFQRDLSGLFEAGRVVRWQRKRFSKMGYSFLPVASTPLLRDWLAEPVASLFFAGEATNRSQPSTVHGALESGIRAAHQILQAVGTQTHGHTDKRRPLASHGV
jgi:monoamine oxidase